MKEKLIPDRQFALIGHEIVLVNALHQGATTRAKVIGYKGPPRSGYGLCLTYNQIVVEHRPPVMRKTNWFDLSYDEVLADGWQIPHPLRCDLCERIDAEIIARLDRGVGYARLLLRRRMADICEARWCAGWIGALEYILWADIVGDPSHAPEDVYGTRRPTEGEKLEDLRNLAIDAGGWWTWPAMAEAQFVPMHEWESIYRTYAKESEITYDVRRSR